jgi:hypothetical protein
MTALIAAIPLRNNALYAGDRRASFRRNVAGEKLLMSRGSNEFARASEIERRAQKISDPIERLKYLRTNASGRKSSYGWRWAASLVLAVAIAFLGARNAQSRQTVTVKPPTKAEARISPALVTETPAVWPVEQNNQYDLYSNGLRIENSLMVANQPRSYALISRESGNPAGQRTQPAGIVFHMTESPQASFEPEEKATLMRIGQGLLLYVRSKRAYHFVIDRFGRVHRIVAESDSANHAGNSVWADSEWLYVDLNASFIGVAFEGQTRTDEPAVNDAQFHAARLLTEMLRDKYNLPADNCVTHAQVSVNPDNMRIGWHTDWGATFAFKEVGLPDNYEIPNPALYVFGFEYDQAYVNSTGPGLWKGLALAETKMREGATGRGLTMVQYRQLLQQRYKSARAVVKSGGVDEEKKAEEKNNASL